MGIVGFGRKVFERFRSAYEMSGYTAYNRAEYLRKAGAQVGEGCFIVPTQLGTEPYLVKIGNHVTIAAGATFITHDGAAWIFRHEVPDLQVFGPIVIEDNCVIGAHSTIFPNVRIGRNSIVGAGSVVISDIPPNTLAMGVPARAFGSIERYRQKCMERWTQQKPPDVVLEAGETWWNSSHFSENRERLRRHLLQLFEAELGTGDRISDETTRAAEPAEV